MTIVAISACELFEPFSLPIYMRTYLEGFHTLHKQALHVLVRLRAKRLFLIEAFGASWLIGKPESSSLVGSATCAFFFLAMFHSLAIEFVFHHVIDYNLRRKIAD